MFLKSLCLENFRNYAELELAFDRHKTIFLGDNAQGKTNLLEAIAVLATGSSPFTSKDQELIRWQQDAAIVRSQTEREVGPTAIDLLFKANGRRAVRVDGAYQRRVSDLLGRVVVVLFAASDLQLVKGAPADRRRYLDGILMQLAPTYYQALHHYNRVLTQRNNVLRQIAEGASAEQLSIWDEQLVHYGVMLWHKREQLIEKLTPRAVHWHREIAKGNEDLGIRLVPSMDLQGKDYAEAFLAELQASRAKEIARGQTLSGPHRDDVALSIDGHDARAYASQGQQRTVVLALKLSELDVFRQDLGEPPLLLLDDVLAELDIRRQNALLAAIGSDVQTFVTSTHLSDFTAAWIDEAAIFSVHRGVVKPFVKAF
jgi:DNA replication and repair protein RecF